MQNVMRRFVGVLALAVFAVDTQAAEIRLTPVGATGTHTIVGNEIRLAGAGQRVTLNVQLRAWAPSGLKLYQAKIESAGFGSGTSGLLAAAQVACPGITTAGHAVCAAALGTGSRCTVPGGAPFFCEAGFINANHADFVFLGFDVAQVAVDLSSPNFRFTSILNPGFPAPDPGVTKYAATVVLNVPAGAQGTFTVGLQPGSGVTFMADENNLEIEPLNLIPARIVIQCSTNANCNDNNLCTSDTCNTTTGVCANTPNFNTATQCCNPTTGGLTLIADANQCTDDVCNSATGQVTHPNSAALTACGNGANSQCDHPDSCNGLGVCLTRVEPVGVACGDATNTQCNLADTCNGSGACQTNLRPVGFACGSSSDTTCDNPDTCNGGGTCLPNNEADNAPCNDGFFCTLNERCQAAVCTGGTPRDCADSLTCTDDLCNEAVDACQSTLQPGKCLIGGVCYIDGDLDPTNTCADCNPMSNSLDWSILADGSSCNDGDACTGTGRPGIGLDTCATGTCAGTPDPECNADCEFAVPVVVGANFSNNNNAGIDDGEASCQLDSNNDVWFKFAADCDGVTFMSTSPSLLSPSNDTVLNVYTNCPGLGGVEIECDDDSGVGLRSALNLVTTGGTTYWIRVAGFEENKGNITLTILPVDDCLIDGVCYAAGEHNPENDCQACVPQVSTTAWSNRPEGSVCGSGLDTECDSPDACDGAGLCEVNYKPDGTPCPDEFPANVCSFDLCEAGACTHPPQPQGLACGNPSDTECDNPDLCDGGGACNPSREGAGVACGSQSDTNCDNPDSCNGLGGCVVNHEIEGATCSDSDVCTSADSCVSGNCVGQSVLLPPMVVALSSKHIRITPQTTVPAPISLRVTSPTWPCLLDYVSTNLLLVPPAQQVFRLPVEWGSFVLTDPDIFPTSSYRIRSECGAYFSAPATVSTWKFADLDLDGDVDGVDVVLVVDAFKSIYGGTTLERADVFPCIPNGIINGLDVVVVVDAYKELPYFCSPPCHP